MMADDEIALTTSVDPQSPDRGPARRPTFPPVTTDVRPSAPPAGVPPSAPPEPEVEPVPSTSGSAFIVPSSPPGSGPPSPRRSRPRDPPVNQSGGWIGSHDPSTSESVAGPSSLQAVTLGIGRENEAFRLDEDVDYVVAPPTYDEVINSTRFPIVRTGTRLSASGEGGSWRLDFVDFTPHMNVAGDRHVGDFRTLVKRANTWLRSNPDVELKTCETITWTATSLVQMNETDAVCRSKSLTASLKTRYLRGLRLWFVPGCDRADPHLTINMEDFAPEGPADSMETLVRRANKQLKQRPLSGSVVTMETVFTRSRRGKIYANATFWAESPAKARQYTFFLRVFYAVGTPRREEIGIKDFLPEQRSDSYENFSQVTEKGCRWAAGQADVSITNMQAVFVKRKGSPETSHSRCFYTEHALKSECRVTYYYQVLRTYYTRTCHEVNAIVQLPVQLTKKTFAPTMLQPTGDEREPKFESFTKTVERVSSWLDSTRAEVFCIETVPVRMNTGTQQRMGPEATLVWSQPEAGVRCEDWLLFVRVYVKGDYQELRVHHALSMPPVDWYRRQRHEPVRRPARRKRNCFVFCLVFLFLITASFVIVYIFMNLVWKMM